MKKTFLFSLGLILALSALFVSCKDEPDNNKEENSGIPCEINIIASEGGYVQFSDYFGNSKHVYTGSKVTIIATADEGYAFIGWYVVGNNEKLVSKTMSYTFTTQGDLQLVAKFGKLQDITIGSNGDGTVSFKDIADTSLKDVLIGSEVTVIATPDENCDFLGWFIGDGEEPVSTDVSYTFTVSENVSLVAKFNQWPLVSISSGANGSVSFENSAETSLFVQSGSEVTVIAVPDENYNFLGWFIGDGEKRVSTDATYTFTVSENIALLAKFEEKVYYNGHEYVDLGLPSGTKWAACNVGANKPEEYGGYYAWGETEEKSNYDWSTYKWCNGSENTMTKYCTESDYGTVDYKTVLDPEDDVAHVKWGGSWRMPTKAEQDELHNKCSWTWTAQNSVNGYRVTGPNGNSIFLPAAGYRCGTDVNKRGDSGYYWSGSLDDYYCSYACGLYFFDDGPGWYEGGRHYGRSVRPVSK